MMRVVVAAMLTGCNWVYGIDETAAVTDKDSDGDMIPDALDNCPARSNDDQYDADEDTLGDRCDNCPLTSNPDQLATGDGDDIGDMCDPHPGTPGDCLVLYDTFDTMDAVNHWTITSSGAQPVITPNGNGTVTVTPAIDTNVFVLARDDSGPLQGVFDGQLTAELSRTDGQVYLMSNAAIPSMGYGCVVSYDQMFEFRGSAYTGGAGTAFTWFPTYFSSDPANTNVALRLTSGSAADPFTQCRIELGFAAGLFSVQDMTPGMTSTPTAGGSPGIRLYSTSVVLDSLALYRSQPTACPDTIYR